MERTHRQIRSFWPDVAEPFAEVIPSGCLLVRTEDEWRRGVRRRLVDLRPDDGAPDLDTLVEEAQDDAFRHGWTPLHEDGETPRYELENVILTIRTGRVDLLIGDCEVLRVQFEQPWPEDYDAPVETSELFQNLVRSLLGLGGDPERLAKTVVFDPLSAARADILYETVEMPSTESLAARFDELAFVPPEEPGGPWKAQDTVAENEVRTFVTKSDGWVRVEMEKRRMLA